ncbi:MAG: hypothetical protein ACR2L2_18730 [Acidobacteriota bacterium]
MKIRTLVLTAALILGLNGSAAAQPALSEFNIIFCQIAVGGGYVTVVTLIHSDARSTTAATGKLRFFTPQGNARTVQTAEMGAGSEFQITIPAGGVRVVTITSAGAVEVGMARYDAESAVAVGGVATFTIGSAVVGVLHATPVRIGYIPLNTRSGFGNGVALTNGGQAPVNIRLRIYGPDGALDYTSSPSELNPLPANGQYARFVGNEMGFSSTIRPDSTLEIEVQGQGSFAVLPLVLGNGLISSSGVIGENNETPLYFPQAVDGGGYATVIRFFNPGATSFIGTLRFSNPDGTARQVAVVGRGTSSQFLVQIPAKGTVALETTGTSSITVGMARLDSTAPIGGVATIFFGSTHLGVPSSTPMRSGRIAINTSGNNTGFALANGGPDPLNLRLTLQNRDGSGSQAVQPAGVNPLASNAQFARYVTEVGLTGTANLVDSSLLIEPTGAGSFIPLALLDRGGVFSTTATLRRTLYGAPTLAGNYTGQWNNLRFGSSGSMTTNIVVDTNNLTGSFTLDLNGSVFGGNDPPPETYNGTYGVSGVNLSSNSPLFGIRTLTIKPDGTLTMRAYDVPNPNITFFTMDGEFTGTRFVGTFLIGFPDLSTASGTFFLNKQ